VLQAQTAYSQAVLNRTQAQGDAANTEGLLASTLGLRPDQPMRIVPPIDLPARQVVERSVSELIDDMRRQRPELAAAQAQVRAAESNIRVQQAAAKPNVSLFGIAGATAFSPGSDPLTGAIGLSVNIPIFTGFFNTYRIRAARDLAEAEAANRDRLENDLALEVWRSYQELRTQGQALVTATDLETSAQESYNVALARYRAGVGTVIDLLNAQSTLADASVQRIQARLQWNVSKAALARAIGVLDPALVGKVAGQAGAVPAQQ
jgi:outer membrane protein TolC